MLSTVARDKRQSQERTGGAEVSSRAEVGRVGAAGAAVVACGAGIACIDRNLRRLIEIRAGGTRELGRGAGASRAKITLSSKSSQFAVRHVLCLCVYRRAGECIADRALRAVIRGWAEETALTQTGRARHIAVEASGARRASSGTRKTVSTLSSTTVNTKPQPKEGRHTQGSAVIRRRRDGE